MYYDYEDVSALEWTDSSSSDDDCDDGCPDHNDLPKKKGFMARSLSSPNSRKDKCKPKDETEITLVGKFRTTFREDKECD